MSRVIVRTGTAESFFRRARSAARRADEGEAFDGAITLRSGCLPCFQPHGVILCVR
jgi:hypothetical protein